MSSPDMLQWHAAISAALLSINLHVDILAKIVYANLVSGILAMQDL